MINRCLVCKLPVAGGEEISHGLGLGHAAVCQYGSGGMTSNAILGIRAIDHVIGSLAAPFFAKFFRNICLRESVFAGRPGVISLMIGVGKKQVPVTLTADLAAVVQRDELRSFGIEEAEGRREGLVISRNIVAALAI